MSNQHHHRQHDHPGHDHPTPHPAPAHTTPAEPPANPPADRLPAHTTPAEPPANTPPDGPPAHATPAAPPSHTTPATPLPSGQEAAASIIIEKEFELERMVLFSDAVFAIAITLLVIDIKWPDLHETLKGVQLLQSFVPTIVGLMAFALSFFYIGHSWALHLRIFRLVRKYDHGLIRRNLFFLFFIVIFPFANSGFIEHSSVTYALSAIVYMSNMALLSYAHYRLCRYVIAEKPSLSVEGRKAEKIFVLTRSRYMMLVAGGTPVVATGLWILFPAHPQYILYSFLFMLAALRFAKHRLKAIYPPDSDKE